MQELLSQLASHPDAVAILSIALGFAAGVTFWLSLQWRLHRRTQLEAALKQDMLNRGMSAGEIERVLRASSSGPWDGAVAKGEACHGTTAATLPR